MRLVNLNTQKIITCKNIQQVHGNSKWKYPNKISYFTFQTSLTASLIFQGMTDRPLVFMDKKPSKIHENLIPTKFTAQY